MIQCSSNEMALLQFLCILLCYFGAKLRRWVSITRYSFWCNTVINDLLNEVGVARSDI